MGLFGFLKGKKKNVDWEEIRTTNAVYPSNFFSIIMVQAEGGKPATGWVYLGYKDYRFKEYCPFNLQFNIWFDDNTSDDLDMNTVENYFVNILKKGCVVHKVSRVATDFGMQMDLYLDNAEFAQKTLGELSESDNKLVELGCGFNEDPQWNEFNSIMTLTE